MKFAGFVPLDRLGVSPARLLYGLLEEERDP